jgi:putative phosphoribosyl transferase
VASSGCIWSDRAEAGRSLARRLARRTFERPLVLALPGGGAVLGFEIARALRAPLDVWGVRRIDAPSEPELGVAAVAEGGGLALNRAIIAEVGLAESDLARLVAEAEIDVERRARVLRCGRPPPSLAGCTVLLVDDGVATGGTAQAAAAAVRAQAPLGMILVVGVAPATALSGLLGLVDEVVAGEIALEVYSIGLCYEQFAPVSDEEVIELLERSRRAR